MFNTDRGKGKLQVRPRNYDYIISYKTWSDTIEIEWGTDTNGIAHRG